MPSSTLAATDDHACCLGRFCRSPHAYSDARGPFHVIEVWVENDTMVEVLPPDFAAEYLAWTRPDTVATRMASEPSSGARHARAGSA